jgi:hypothetical protein
MIGFKVGKYNPAYRLIIDPEWEWNTFLGSSSSEKGYGIAVDGSGNVYVAGSTYLYSWGSPVRAHDVWSDDALQFNSGYSIFTDRK